MEKKTYNKMKENSRATLNESSKADLIDHIFNLYKMIQARWIEIDDLMRALRYAWGIMVILITAIIIIISRVDTWI